jgi:hypothetical protein
MLHGQDKKRNVDCYANQLSSHYLVLVFSKKHTYIAHV